MKITIHRGKNQIGGNIVEVSSKSTKILLDVGLDLDDEKNKELPKIDGLFDKKGFDAVFISHYHGDHMGLVYDIFKDIPVYIGEASYKITRASDDYKGNITFTPAGFLKNKKPIMVGDIKVTPYLCDHSAFDSYMLFVEADGETLLYTEDFRSNGRKLYTRLLQSLPNNVDYLICEGTTLSRNGEIMKTEADLEKDAVKLFRNSKGPIFILQSTTNIDRIVTMYRSAKRSGRVFLQDLYMAEITNSIGGNIPNPFGFTDVKTFLTRPYDKDHFRYLLFNKYDIKKIGKTQIAQERFVMCVRSSMLNYLKSLNKLLPFEDGLLIYSFWSGYREQEDMKIFLDGCKNMGLTIVTLHTSGHADEYAINQLIQTVKPKSILPIHTENAEWFNNK